MIGMNNEIQTLLYFFVLTTIIIHPVQSFLPLTRHGSTTAYTTTSYNNNNHNKNQLQHQQQRFIKLSSDRNSIQPVLYGSKISDGDTVVIIGGTGGVGQLVGKKLSSGKYGTYNVRVTSRNVDSAITTLDDPNIQVVQVDLVNGSTQQIEKALEGATAIVISVGTTAFPTQRWFGGNTPDAIDNIAVTKIASVASQLSSLQKIILVTSIGIDRTDTMPFQVLNLFGVLDAKKKGETAVISSNKDYVFIRPGRLIGGPFTNLDVARLLQIQGGTENGVTIASGDTLLGDCKRDACSEAVIQTLCSEICSNVTFSIISNNEIPSLSTEQWKNEFTKLHT